MGLLVTKQVPVITGLTVSAGPFFRCFSLRRSSSSRATTSTSTSTSSPSCGSSCSALGL